MDMTNKLRIMIAIIFTNLMLSIYLYFFFQKKMYAKTHWVEIIVMKTESKELIKKKYM